MESDAALISFIDRLRSSKTIEDAWSIFDAEVKTFGIENALYSFVSGEADQLLVEDTFFHSHREDFLTAYDSGGYMECDWSVLHSQNSTETVLWSTPDLVSRLSAKQIAGERLAQDFGLLEGISLPLRGGSALGWGGVGLSATGMKSKEWRDLLASHQSHLEALVQAFHEFILSKGFFNSFRLSAREHEVLKWLVRGFDKHGIADKLNISSRTSEVHMYSIRRKLKCANDVQVAVKALTFNLI